MVVVIDNGTEKQDQQAEFQTKKITTLIQNHIQFYARYILDSNFTLDHQMMLGAGIDLRLLTATERGAEGHDFTPASTIEGKRTRILE